MKPGTAQRCCLGLFFALSEGNSMSQPGKTFLLFVYGTPKRGGCRHGALAGQRFRSEARTEPLYDLHNLGDYPGLTNSPLGREVLGEVYEVDEALLPWLDTVEGAPDWFKLEPISLRGYPDAVWAYFYQGDPSGHPLIVSGRWNNESPR
jgi:gamma-glutamylaminecyclotransferase